MYGNNDRYGATSRGGSFSSSRGTGLSGAGGFGRGGFGGGGGGAPAFSGGGRGSFGGGGPASFSGRGGGIPMYSGGGAAPTYPGGGAGSSRGGFGGGNNPLSGVPNVFSRDAGPSGGGFGAPRSYEDRYGGGAPGSGLNPVDWRKRDNLEPIKKNIYQESPVVAGRSDAEIDQWIKENQVTLKSENALRPVLEFNEAGFPQPIVDLLYKNYEKPTVIQSISWPVALSGLDMISIAKTGSGKTLGFLLPGILHILANRKREAGEGPRVLVLLPTRELAQQVQEVANSYCAAMGLMHTCLFGGAPKGAQMSDLRRGVDVCVATPGRLLDFLESGATKLDSCSFLVLDEADRMLDMGFEPQIRKIVSQIRPDRQTLMFSATWPKEVRALARDFQSDPVFLNVGSLDLAANHNIEQIVEVLDEHSKQARLFQLLEAALEDNEPKILVFLETKRKADELTYIMRKGGWPALCIHGDKEQRERDWVLSEFKTGKVPILLATDVAARGLDVQNIKVVINYDYSTNSENYVHRIGRTGRQEKKGIAYTFFTPQNAPKARDLIQILEEANQPVPDALKDLASGGYTGTGANSRWRGGSGGERSRGGGYQRSYY